MILDPFVGPTLKIEHGRGHIKALDTMLAEHAEKVKCGFVKVDDPSCAPLVRLQFAFSEGPPQSAPLMIGDAVHNLRAALDLAMCDIARLRDKSADKVKFPFAENSAGLEKTIKKSGLRRLGDDVVQVLMNLKPYKGGNIGLRGLHDLDVSDKHKLVLPIYLAVPFHSPRITVGALTIDFGGFQTHLHAGSTMHVAPDAAAKFEAFKGKVYAAFPTGLPFAGEPVVETLHKLAQLATGVVDLLRRQFGGGNAPAASTP